MQHKKVKAIIQMDGREDSLSGTSIIGISVDETRKEQVGDEIVTKASAFSFGNAIPPEKILDTLEAFTKTILTKTTFREHPAVAYAYLFQLGKNLQKAADKHLQKVSAEEAARDMTWLGLESIEIQRRLSREYHE